MLLSAPTNQLRPAPPSSAQSPQPQRSSAERHRYAAHSAHRQPVYSHQMIAVIMMMLLGCCIKGKRCILFCIHMMELGGRGGGQWHWLESVDGGQGGREWCSNERESFNYTGNDIPFMEWHRRPCVLRPLNGPHSPNVWMCVFVCLCLRIEYCAYVNMKPKSFKMLYRTNNKPYSLISMCACVCVIWVLYDVPKWAGWNWIQAPVIAALAPPCTFA